ncbi:AarF/UbiB family protein [Oligoflexus tunisiensis]|uniref:AarF/UbiB family protein n=1 Tax=Oligoflexus tunisiensis TaxID=708132 RepID=UPI00159F049B|nr:AarF/UbiB family protein [Oligoflexus tunisiensis]
MTTALSRLATGLKYSSILAKSVVLKNWNEAASRHYLLENLGSIPGVSAKAAQFLAMKLGAGDGQNPLHLEPLPLPWIKSHIEAACPRLHAELVEISEKAQVASLGQVHEGRLRSGATVAIKIQYPDLQKNLEEQLDLLRQVSKTGPPKKFQFEVEAILDYCGQSLLREIDYRGEAQRQMEATRLLPQNKPIIIAHVYPEYSCTTILTQSFEASSPIARIRPWWPDAARRECARILLDYFLHALFVARSVHTDPHPGNLGFRHARSADRIWNHELVLYDFGSTMSFEPHQVEILWHLIHAYQNQLDIVPFDALVALGFDAQKLLRLSQRLPCLLERLLEPFCQDRAFDVRHWDLKEHFERVLGEDRWWFRSAVPPWFLLLLRAMQGLIHALSELQVPVSIKSSLMALKLPAPTGPTPQVLSQLQSGHRASTGAMAKKLLVVIQNQKGNELVRIELPSRAVDKLEEHLPNDTLGRMQERKLDLATLKRRIQQSGYAPQILFEMQSDEKRYQVWLQ